MFKEKIINVQTNEESWREYTDAEIAEVEKAQAQVTAEAKAAVETALARTALLEKLGITEEEAKLLLS